MELPLHGCIGQKAFYQQGCFPVMSSSLAIGVPMPFITVRGAIEHGVAPAWLYRPESFYQQGCLFSHAEQRALLSSAFDVFDNTMASQRNLQSHPFGVATIHGKVLPYQDHSVELALSRVPSGDDVHCKYSCGGSQ